MLKLCGTRQVIMTASLACVVVPGIAHAQVTLDDSPIPLNYSRDRNVSVLERSRPEVDSTGVPLGGFTLLPRIDLGVSRTNNAFQNDSNKKSDTIFSAVPNATLNSNWSRHSLNLSGGGRFERYSDNSIRNEDGWNVNAGGRVDMGSTASLFLNAGTGRFFESGFSGGNVATIGEPIPFQRTNLNSRLQLVRGRFRVIGAVDYVALDYKNSSNLAGATVVSDNRDRKTVQGTGQVEYGFSPDASAFVKLSYSDTAYDFEQSPGVANRDSNTTKIIGGVTFDVSSLVRGTVGLGYSKRTFDSPLYLKSSGFSYEAQIEYFLSPLTTITLGAKRQLRDSSIPGSSDFFETLYTGRVDHELLRNLLLRLQASFGHENYRGITSTADIFRIGGGARYLMNRNIALDLDLSHGKRSSKGVSNGAVFSEDKGGLSLTFKL